MTFLKAVPTIFCLALTGAIVAPSAQADEWNKKTVMTFSDPVEIPGVHLKGWAVLPAGTYVFRLLNSASDRHIVQILSQDELTVYATILAIPNYRLKATDKTVITFNEGIQGRPEAIRAWFYPGANWGEEFVYPKAKAIELAKATNTPVIFTAVEIPLEVATPIKSVDEPVVALLRRAPLMAIRPTGEQVEVAQVVTPPPPEKLAAAASVDQVPAPAELPARRLPATASSLPMVGLFGVLALAGALAIRFAKNRAV